MSITETGPQRAQRRAALHGLTVGAPVRARIGIGVGHRTAAPHPLWVPYGQRTYAGPGGATPLGRVDRLARYLLQRDVTTHVRHGSSWQPTPRQRRRLDHKARHAAAPFGRDYIAEAYVAGNTPAWPTVDQRAEPVRALIEAGHVIHPDSPAEYAAAMADTRGPAASAVIVDEPPQFMEPGARRRWPVVPSWVEPPPTEEVNPTPRERSAMSRGFRVVDRRGEHR